MTTSCPTCGSLIVQRQWLVSVPPLFVEVYACGAVHQCGLIIAGRGVMRECPHAVDEPAEVEAETPTNKDKR